MATDDERLVADQERQQRVQAQAAIAAKQAAEGEVTSSLGGAIAKLSPTTRALQFAWRFYLPTFTLTSIYIVLHILLRYVFQFKFFCPADQGAPLAGVAKVAKAIGTSGSSGGGMMEKAWIALSLASIGPICFAILLFYAVAYTYSNLGNFLGALLTGDLW